MRKFKIKALFIALAGSIFISVSAGAVGASTFSLGGSGSYSSGSSVAVTINENSGAVTVNSIQADIQYDSTKLQYVGFSGGSLSCPIVMPAVGSVSIGCMVAGSTVAGAQSVGTVSFKALVGSGSTIVSVLQSSQIVHPDSSTSSSDTWNHASVGATISFNTPSSPTPTPTPTPTSTTNTTQNTQSTQSNSTQNSTTQSSTQQTSAQPATSNQPQVAGESVVTYSVTVLVTNSNGTPIVGATVKQSGSTQTTDKAGKAVFASVKGGVQEFNIQGKNISKTIVKAEITKQDQQITVIASYKRNYVKWLVLLAVIGGSGTAFYFGKSRFNQVITRLKKPIAKQTVENA